MAIRDRTFLLALGMWAVFALLMCAGARAEGEGREAPEPAALYKLGEGLRIGDTGLRLGGYGAVQYQGIDDRDTPFSVSHLSLFVWWGGNSRLKFFSEVDSQGLQAKSGPPGDSDGGRHYLEVERLYFDYTFDDSLTMRGGKFLTPIGRWNHGHADPLVWTTSRPLITRDMFPDNATGLMAFGSVAVGVQPVDYTLFASSGSELRPDPDQDPFNDGYGLRLNLPMGENFQLGMSYASFDQRAARDERKRLYGLDFMWAADGYELSGEAIYRMSSAGTERNAKGMFIQAVVPMYARFWAVGRIESMRDPESPAIMRQVVAGVVYRTANATSFKLEYLRAPGNDQRAPRGIMSSVSVLF